MISTNKDLSQAIENVITENGIKKIWIAEQLGVANQNVNKLINKKNISLDDANRILAVIGYKASIVIEKQ
jgi:plasmid maintenance system antidote protein VapI